MEKYLVSFIILHPYLYYARNKTCTVAMIVIDVIPHVHLSSGSGAKYTYDRFPSVIRTAQQEEKRKQILAAASGASEYSGRHTPRYI